MKVETCPKCGDSFYSLAALREHEHTEHSLSWEQRALEAENKLPSWRNVESSVLPDPGFAMLGWREGRGIGLCYYVERPEGFRMWTWNGHSGGPNRQRDEPTHWMPLPEPPPK